MKLTNLTKTPLWLGLLALVLAQQLEQSGADETGKLPSLWESLGRNSKDDKGEPNKAYHVIYQIQLSSAADALTVEEWADYEQRQFRIDLITKDKARITYLFNGETHEMFCYKPYVCEPLKEHAASFAALSKLLLGHTWSKLDAAGKPEKAGAAKLEPVVAYGLGPLWLELLEQGKLVEVPLERPALLSKEHDNADQYKVYVVRGLNLDSKNYRLHFYFPRGEKKFVESILWVRDDGDQEGKVDMLLKVLSLDREAPDASEFKLPIGYGCKRRPGLDEELHLDVGQVLLHRGWPNQVAFEVTFSEPQDEVLHSWLSQHYSIRATRLSRARQDDVSMTEGFFSTLIQSRSALNGGRLQRIKRVWRAVDDIQGQASVYVIDEETGACKVGHQDIREQIVLGYLDPSALAVDANVKPMVLSFEQISFLFSDNTGYHLIDRGTSDDDDDNNTGASAVDFRDRYFEKRVENFKLTTDGTVSWQGPVSIVKRISRNPEPKYFKKNSLDTIRATLLEDYQTTLTLFMYSEDYEKLEYKVVIQLLGNHPVPFSYAWQQMDISVCFEPAPEAARDESTDDWLKRRQPTTNGLEGRAKQVIEIKYPLEDPRLAAKLSSEREYILTQLYIGLFNLPMSFLSPLQVNDMKLYFDLFYMRLQLTIYDLPLSQLFDLELGKKLVPKSGDSKESRWAVTQSTSSTLESCSEHCEYFNCFRFSYDQSRKVCHVQLVPEETVMADCDTCQLFTYYDRRSSIYGKAPALKERPHLSADTLVGYFERLVEVSLESQVTKAQADWTNPLEIDVILVEPFDSPEAEAAAAATESGDNRVLLRPSSIKHELEAVNEFERELNEIEAGDGSATSGEESRIMRQVGGKQLKLQFELLLENAEFETVPDKDKFEEHTYEDCEQRCELEDCRIFSYCAQQGVCKLKWKYDDKILKKSMVRREPSLKCNIYLIDNLSKFENFGRVPPPSKASRTIALKQPMFCANTCMENEDFKCQGFYFCTIPTKPSQHFCHLVDRHLDSRFEEKHRGETYGFGPPPGDEQALAKPNEEVCDFYSRSYLAQFDKYFGKSLELPKVLYVKTRGSLVAERCADACVLHQCVAFDACLEQSEGRNTGYTQCNLLMGGFKKSQMKPATRCTTFVLSDKSHIKSQMARKEAAADAEEEPGAAKPDREAELGPVGEVEGEVLDEEEAKLAEADADVKLLEELYKRDDHNLFVQHVNSSHWLARLFSLALGVALGCLIMFAWNAAYVRGWTEQVRQVGASALARVR